MLASRLTRGCLLRPGSHQASVLCALIVLVPMVGQPAATAETAARPPNVVILLADDLGYGDVNFGIDEAGAFLNPHIRTPHLADFAREGLLLTHHYAAHPTCSPSRAGLLTGRIPTRTNIHQWIDDLRDNDRFFLRGQEVTIAELLRGAGYATAVFGKWHLNGADWDTKANWTGWTGSFPAQQGFEFGLVSKENPHRSRRLAQNSQKDPGDFFSIDGTPQGTISGYSSQIITDAALEWLDELSGQDRPFFLYVPYDAVHEVIVNPPEYDRMYDTGIPEKDQYFANVTYLDHQIGRLLDGLKRAGLDEETVVIFSSDNGPEALQCNDNADRCYGTSYPLRGQKRQLYEGGIRVPGIVRWTGRISPGISHEPIGAVDFLPTICKLAQVEVPETLILDGASVVDHLLHREPVERTQPLYWELEMRRDYTTTTGEGYDRRFDGRTKTARLPTPQVVIRQGNYVLRGLHCGEAFCLPTKFALYDVVNDPDETHELSHKHPELIEQMKRSLRELHASVQEDRKVTQAGIDANRPPSP